MTALPKMNKYKTGWCNVGQCEGTKKKSPSGVPYHICTDYLTCPCECHARITEMYKLTGLPRPVPEQSPERQEYIAEGQLEMALMLADVRRMTALSTPNGLVTHPATESPVGSDGDPATGTTAPARPTFTPTPTGIRPKGQLEYDVLLILVDFHNEVYEESLLCTPKMISNEIAKRNTSEPPSTGAVNAVLERWDALEFIAFYKKPTRFESFLGHEDDVTLEEIMTELAERKSRQKRTAKLSKSADRRGANLDLAGRKAARRGK